METINRRNFLKISGSFSIGFSLFGCISNAFPTSLASTTSLPDASQIDAWLQILADGKVRVLTGKMELGQGLRVVMQQVAGEELNISPSQIEVILADTGITQNEGYTAGSRSVERSAMNMRRAAAAAREYLLNLACKHWHVSKDSLVFEGGNVFYNNERISLKELLKDEQLTAKIPTDVPLKPKADYQWAGNPIPHPDLEKIVRGASVYVQDLRFPGMVHARVVRPPSYEAKLIKWPKHIVQSEEVLKIVENGSFLGVIAQTEYSAIKARKRLKEETIWDNKAAFPKVENWAGFMQTQTEVAHIHAGTTHHAIYAKPYTMHGSIGPSCAVAHYNEGELHLWSHTQGVYPLRSTISDMTGLPEAQIRVRGVRGSGCYGHNGADDVAADAALLAMAYPGKHIRLQWERNDEHQWEPYGSAMRMELSAELDDTGMIKKWNYDLWSDSHSTRPRGGAQNFIAARHLEKPFTFKGRSRVGGGTRNSKPYYNIPSIKVQDHYVAGPLRTSALRTLGAYANIFAIESFMNELAEKVGMHPLDFRLKHSSDPRSIAVLEQLKAMSKSISAEEGEGIGFGFSRYKNTASYCATGAKIFVDASTQTIRPIHFWAVIDAGETINPDGLKNQTEGGMIQAASWTIKEEVLFDKEAITSKDWASYPILRYNDVPTTDVVIIDRPNQPPLGAGEAVSGPVAAAIANAVYQACGKRVRELPIEGKL